MWITPLPSCGSAKVRRTNSRINFLIRPRFTMGAQESVVASSFFDECELTPDPGGVYTSPHTRGAADRGALMCLSSKSEGPNFPATLGRNSRADFWRDLVPSGAALFDI